MALRSALLFLLLPLLCLPVLSGPAAKPPARPRTDGSALVSRPVLTAAELDALAFSAAADSSRPWDQSAREDVKNLSLGVWVSCRAYREGEPIPALFAVRNRGPRRGLDMRIELAPAEAGMYNGARIRLERTNPGNTWRQRLQHTYICGGPPLAGIEHDGYHCSGGDLRALGGGQLPAGAYCVWWSYSARKSNVVEFTVLPNRDGQPGAGLSRRALAGIIELTGGKLEGLTDGAREHSLRLTGARAAHRWPREVGPHLASGVAGKYYPSLADLPVLDGGLEATARLLRREPAALPFAVEVTLRAALGGKDMVLARDLHLALLVEPQPGNLDRVLHNGPRSERAPDMMSHNHEFLLDRPLVLRIDLPANWERHARLTGPARVAVLVSTERLHRREPGRQVTERVRRAGGSPRQEWRGVLRSPWLEVAFPPRPAKAP